ncbi:MAG: nucleotidyltransferase domain-containing protein [Chloroflexota bacterium]
MNEFKSPTPLHTTVLEQGLETLKANANVLGVVLVGSLARGTARRDSDIDLLVVQAGGERVTERQSHGQIVLECTFRTSASWAKQFIPTQVGDESWGYAFLDGLILYDPSGVVVELVDSAAKMHSAYRTPKHIVDHYLWLWSHMRPKMKAVLQSRDATEIGWSAAIMSHPIIQTIWVINDLPQPSLDLGCVQRHLNDLTLPTEAPDLIREMLQASPESTLRIQLRILDTVVPKLKEQAR